MPLEIINPIATSNTGTLSVTNNANVGGSLAVTGTTILSSNLTVVGGFVPSSSYNLRNKIINGNFDFWQRGTSTSVNSYLADRWQNESVGSTFTSSRQSFALGQTSVPNEPTYFHRTVVSSVAGSGNYCIVRQPIESVRTFAGKTATLSFWAKADSNKNIAVEFIQTSGSGGSPVGGSTGATNGQTKTFSLTSSWQKFTATISIPSISGYTLGTDGNDHIRIQFWFDAGSTFNSRTNSLGQQSGTFDIAQVQLEEGSVATPFEVRPTGLELSLCQRYYNKSYNVNLNPGTITNSGYFLSFAHNTYTLQQTSIRFPVAMRGSQPTCTLYSAGTGASNKTYDVLGAVDVVTSSTYSGSLGFEVNGFGNFITGKYYTFHYTAESEL